MTVTVTQLNYYPVKSCAGHSVQSRQLDLKGLRDDRDYMVVDFEGNFLTQREFPRLSMIRPTIKDDVLELSAPGMGPINIPRTYEGTRLEVAVWRDTCMAVSQGKEAGEWLTAYLGTVCQLVRKAPDDIRLCDPAYATSETDQNSFSDAFPFLLISEESLEDLNNRMDFPVPMNRFRPNIVVSGGGAFAEDLWRQIRIGDITFDVVKACARCKTTTVDQMIGVAGKEPLRTLATFRNRDGKTYFGQNLVHKQLGTLTVGTEVEIVATKESLFA